MEASQRTCDDEPVKWLDGSEVEFAEENFAMDKRRYPDTLPHVINRRYVYDDSEIEMTIVKAEDNLVTGLGEDRKETDLSLVGKTP